MAIIAQEIRDIYGISESESAEILEKSGIFRDISVQDIRSGMYPKRLEDVFAHSILPLPELQNRLELETIEEIVASLQEGSPQVEASEQQDTLPADLIDAFHPFFHSDLRVSAYCQLIFQTQPAQPVAISKDASMLHSAIRNVFPNLDENSHLHVLVQCPVEDSFGAQFASHLHIDDQGVYFEFAAVAALAEILEASPYNLHLIVVQVLENQPQNVAAWQRHGNSFLPMDEQEFFQLDVTDSIDNIALSRENTRLLVGDRLDGLLLPDREKLS